jgi:hypothetical protein
MDRVARREGVAGVEADADAVRRGDARADRRQVLQTVPEAGALAGGVFEQQARPAARHFL